MKIRLRDGTGSIELRFLCQDTDRHGNVRTYARLGSRKIRLRATPGTEEFMAQYRAALTSPPATKAPAGHAPGTLRWLLERYYQAAEFRRLGESTRHVRRRLLDGLCGQRFAGETLTHGQKPFAPMQAGHVRRLRDEKAELPEAANARVKALRQVFAWATEAGLAQRNPARDVPYLRPGTEGFHTWSIAEVRQYEDRHPIGSKARLALALLLFTGVRRSDVVRLGPQMEAAGWLRFAEAKGRARLVKVRELPIVPQLRAAIEAAPSGHLNYLTTEFGKPFTPNGFGNWFRKRCDEAELPHCAAHGLRKAGATIAADNGATEHQLMAIYGWESPKQAALYTRKANRKRLAGDAMHLIVPPADGERNLAKVSHRKAAKPSGGTNRSKK